MSFDGLIVEWEDTRFDYGERRMIAVGRVGFDMLTVVYTERPGPAVDHHVVTVEQEGTQAMARMTLGDIRASKPNVDRVKLNATSEADIRRYQTEDGHDPHFGPATIEEVWQPQAVRKRLGLTQERFAEALGIPLATLRNWEQGRVQPDPTARALLKIVARHPDIALAALAPAAA